MKIQISRQENIKLQGSQWRFYAKIVKEAEYSPISPFFYFSALV
jgi:hypothetical protein